MESRPFGLTEEWDESKIEMSLKIGMKPICLHMLIKKEQAVQIFCGGTR